MTVKTARDLAIKVFGLHYIALFIIDMPGLSSAFFMDFSGARVAGNTAYRLLTAAAIVLNLAVGGFFLFRTDRVVRFVWRDDASGDSELPSLGGPLSFWITLIGIYYLIS